MSKAVQTTWEKEELAGEGFLHLSSFLSSYLPVSLHSSLPPLILHAPILSAFSLPFCDDPSFLSPILLSLHYCPLLPILLSSSTCSSPKHPLSFYRLSLICLSTYHSSVCPPTNLITTTVSWALGSHVMLSESFRATATNKTDKAYPAWLLRL